MDESVTRHLEQGNEVADLLRRARALPWANNGSTTNGYCVGQAIKLSAGALMDEAVGTFQDANSIQRTEHLSTLFDWNDAPERTHAEVLAAFDRAIALSESRG